MPLQIPCHVCGNNFESYPLLAKHIIENKKSHRKSLRWAASFTLKVNILNQKKDAPEGRIALTEEQKQSKVDSQRELSGETHALFCVCPICKTKHLERIEREFLEDHGAWLIDKMPVFACLNCRK